MWEADAVGLLTTAGKLIPDHGIIQLNSLAIVEQNA
jgi:hypothetical protein